MHNSGNGRSKPAALSLLASERPRNVSWLQAGGLLFGDWGTSRLYVLGLAFLFAGRTSFWLILLMSVLIMAVGWAYTQICRIYPDGGGVYTAAKHRSRMLAVIGALLLFADYTVTASLSALDAFHYFGLPLEVIAEPSVWYSYHRVPQIVEASKDRTRVLVRFTAASLTGSFGGTCLYAQRDGQWGAYPIRPSESRSMATAEAWLVKRKWEAW